MHLVLFFHRKDYGRVIFIYSLHQLMSSVSCAAVGSPVRVCVRLRAGDVALVGRRRGVRAGGTRAAGRGAWRRQRDRGGRRPQPAAGHPGPGGQPLRRARAPPHPAAHPEALPAARAHSRAHPGARRQDRHDPR